MITLETTKIAFDTWRTTRAKSNTPIPMELWDMVKQLLAKHRRIEIYKTLGISSNQIKKHCEISSPLSVTASNNQKIKEAQEIDDSDFVTAIPLPASGSSSELTLKGSSRSLHLRLPTAALRDVLPIIGELL